MLVTTKEILLKASLGNYAVAATNVATSLEVESAIETAEEMQAPLILDVLQPNLTSCPDAYCAWIRERCKEAAVPVALNIDDDKKFEGALKAIVYGATSIMADRSALPYEENVAQTKIITKIAHAAGICVEAEIREFGPDGQVDAQGLANPEAAVRFAKETGADCLAVALRIVSKEGQATIDFARLKEIKKAAGNLPLVLHGSLGIPAEKIGKACTMGLNKVNLSKDLKAASLKGVLDGGGSGNANDLMKAGFKNKLREMIELYGSGGKA